jgi:hypothetical protein
MKKYILENVMKQARAAATKEMLGYKIQDPEFMKQYVRAKLKKKGIEEE